MTQDNAHDLPGLLKLVEDEGIDRFYFSHLNYAGRGNKNRKDDARHQLTRQAMDLLFDTCWEYRQKGLHKEFTSIRARSAFRMDDRGRDFETLRRIANKFRLNDRVIVLVTRKCVKGVL